MIANDLDLPIGVIMRFERTIHFRIKETKICVRCKINPVKEHLILCNECKDKGCESDIDFYVPESKPSTVTID